MARVRTYSISFKQISVSAVQDLIAVYAGSSMAFEVHSFTLGQITAVNIGNLPISFKRLPATVSAGSGGSSATVQKIMRGDAAATTHEEMPTRSRLATSARFDNALCRNNRAIRLIR